MNFSISAQARASTLAAELVTGKAARRGSVAVELQYNTPVEESYVDPPSQLIVGKLLSFSAITKRFWYFQAGYKVLESFEFMSERCLCVHLCVHVPRVVTYENKEQPNKSKLGYGRFCEICGIGINNNQDISKL